MINNDQITLYCKEKVKSHRSEDVTVPLIKNLGAFQMFQKSHFQVMVHVIYFQVNNVLSPSHPDARETI